MNGAMPHEHVKLGRPLHGNIGGLGVLLLGISAMGRFPPRGRLRVPSAAPRPPRAALATPPAARPNDRASLTGPARAAGGRSGEARNPPLWVREQTGTAAAVVGAIARGSGGGHRLRRWLGGQAECREEPPHGVGFGHRAEDPPRAPAALTDQDLDREHAAEETGPGPSPRVASA
jgi:hypothetical protein